jgi:hypothetical protein
MLKPKPTQKGAPNPATVGTSINITGKNYGPDEPVKVTFTDSAGRQTVVGTPKSSTPGAVSQRFTIPAGTALGKATLSAAGQVTGLTKTAAITIG